MSNTKSNLRFAWITNNAYDTLAIMDDKKVVSQWTVTAAVAQEYVSNKDAAEWDLNFPDESEISDYGQEVVDGDLKARLDFFIR